MLLVGVEGVGEKDSPLSNNVKSSGVSVIVLRLCIVRSGVWKKCPGIKKKKLVRRLYP